MKEANKPAPALSIVIPTYNGRRLLEACLASIEWCAPSRFKIEIIVVDDASTDGTAEWLRRDYPHVRVIRLESNSGFCRAANAGINAATAPVIQMLNNDTEVSTGWIEAGLAPFDDPYVGSVAPLVLSHADPERVDSAGDGYFVFGHPYKRGHRGLAAVWENVHPGEVFGASGSSAFYRAALLKQLGGFDPDFNAYYEDVDLAFRLRLAGYTCRFAPACKILHHVSATYDHANPRLQRQMAKNAELIFWRRLPLTWLLVATIPHVAFLFAQAAHRLINRRFAPFAHGKLDALRTLIRARRSSRPPTKHVRAPRPHLPMSFAPPHPVAPRR